MQQSPSLTRRQALLGGAAALAGTAGLAAAPRATAAVAAARGVTGEPWGSTGTGDQVTRYTLRNAAGTTARILTLGGVLQTLEVPDRRGRLRNVTLGFASVEPYLVNAPNFGAIIGRYANRIANGAFTLDGAAYLLPINNPPNTLHGGPVGFARRVWSAVPFTTPTSMGVRLSYVDPAGEAGFPGTLSTLVTYSLTEDDALRIAFRATTDAPTVVNLTNHAYFNLAGEGAGDVYDTLLRVHAKRYVPIDAVSIPTGRLAPVHGTPFDFATPTAIGARIRNRHQQLDNGRGYDHSFEVTGGGGSRLVRAAEATDPRSGRRLTVWTTEPGVQLYTGNFLDGTLRGTSGRAYRQSDGFALETQHFPDSPNQPGFPSTVLRPGQVYRTTTVYAFSTVR
ncbi:aldose epimerase family protein [Motilibacter aurantiacus]|uniref:aldose epimerase family protein n=1 Tax=Motilibacter aurantiacus TaxID=2714955 RepID=UPI00140806F5|nr:aldose epimerase family protein [Motilibacter aurantiacus]NHC45800.1 galactose mutarotase [Motilibacter aurantiacus]